MGLSSSEQNPSPHLEQNPQSTWQLAQFSPADELQTPLPQKPQSMGHDPGVSPNVQAPSPHRGTLRQSKGQVKIVSPAPQKPSPQNVVGPQS
jgi:hypothetical protein